MKNERKILIDVGSSTVKVYKATSRKHCLLFTKSISFKKDFDKEMGILEENKIELVSLLTTITKAYKSYSIKVYATAIFRKLSEKPKIELVDEIYSKTGLFFNIISHELENHYLELAMTSQYTSSNKVLLVNIGGSSTELVVLQHMLPIEKHNIDMGIGTVLSAFPDVNSSHSVISLDAVVGFVKKKLPVLTHIVKEAFYNGGELTYMQRVGYPLVQNNLFKDPDHPSVINVQDFKKMNAEVFTKITLNELEKLMPSDPMWMHGARACSAIAQAIFEKYGVKIIIPSNSNLIDGVVRKEFRYVTISGSFRKHLPYILEVKQYLTRQNIQVLSPRFTEPKNPGDEFVVFEGEENATPIELERYHLNAITKSDALIVCNPNGYVGASSMIEIGYAQSLGKRIIYVQKPEEFMLNTLPAEIGL